MTQVPDVRTIVDQIKARIADIEEQLKQHRDLSDELNRLRGALSRLEGDVTRRVGGRRGRPAAPVRSRPPAAAKRSTTARTADGGQKQTGKRSVAPRGQTRAKVLEALKDGPMTAGDVSGVTGISRASVSTTLNKLSKSGDVVKAQRGYQLPN
jgi:CRP-like cAMP-binding protein